MPETSAEGVEEPPGEPKLELPIEAGPEGVRPHAPIVGRRWLDFTIAAVAIIISLVSLGVGFENARTERQLVAASSWPFLVYNTSRITQSQINMRIINDGVGPARLKSLIVKYNGQSANGLRELLHLCCGLPKGASWDFLDSLGQVEEGRAIGILSPRQGTDLITISRTPQNAAMWDRLDQARLHLSLEACYCSVLGACWTTDLTPTSDPKPVDECKAGEGYIE
jgi:hypothetical protein